MKGKNYSIDQLVHDPSFVRWTRGTSEGMVTEKWDQWVKQNEENRKLAIRAQHKITGISFKKLQLPDKEYMWAKVNHEILHNEKTKSQPLKMPNKVSSHGYFGSYFLKVAAVLVLGILVASSILMYDKPLTESDQNIVKTIQNDYKVQKTLHLPEGSKIILASNSSLTYKSNWLSKEVKRIKLNGEAYFSITPKQKKGKPKFVVETADGDVSVWGTQFNVDTYGDGTKVVLEEGEVKVKVNNTLNDDHAPVATMSPGQLSTFSQANPQILISNVNSKVYTSWTTDELYFDETPFSVLIDRIERTYGLDVQIDNPQILKTNLSGSLDFKSLDGLTKAISDMMNVEIIQSDKTLYLTKK